MTGSYFGFPSTTGNVSLVNDIYAGGTGGVDTPNSDLNALNASRGISVIHLRIHLLLFPLKVCWIFMSIIQVLMMLMVDQYWLIKLKL